MEPVNVDGPLSALALFSDQLVLAVAADNTVIGETISFDEFCELPYIETRFASQTETLDEQVMRRQWRQHRVRAWFPDFQLTLDAVTNSDMVAMVPSKHGGHARRTRAADTGGSLRRARYRRAHVLASTKRSRRRASVVP
jgi:DNA-binding transcriptional LysR family regulator